MIHVLAEIEIADGQRDAFLVEFHKIVPAVRQEAGCIEYGPAIDAATEIGSQLVNPNVVTVIEKWESVEHLNAHLVAPHMSEYREKVKDLVQGLRLKVLEPHSG